MASASATKEIAERLYLSEGTVKQYINQIYSKLDIEETPEPNESSF